MDIECIGPANSASANAAGSPATVEIKPVGTSVSLSTLRGQAYDSEALLQSLLADYPSLLAGEQVNRTMPKRWLLIRREAGVPSKLDGGNQWAIDNLFLDQ